MCAGLRGQIYAQIFQREYVPAQEHNVVVPRGAVGAHNAQSCACDALVRRLARRFQAKKPLGWPAYISHFSVVFNTKCIVNSKKMPVFVHRSGLTYVPFLSPKSAKKCLFPLFWALSAQNLEKNCNFCAHLTCHISPVYVPWNDPKTLKNAYFERFSQKNVNFLQKNVNFCADISATYVPLFRPKMLIS